MLFQEQYPEGDFRTLHPRRYFCPTKKSREAGDVLWSNTFFTEKMGCTEMARDYLRGLIKKCKHAQIN
ncbi:MAG: hypothetical protein SVY53_06495 [Chloroflexota bacterium]|nr:hypothetical protein [Chloroflexota bacterium]